MPPHPRSPIITPLRALAAAIAAGSLFTASCAICELRPAAPSPSDLRAQVVAALDHYQQAARSTEPDRIAECYAPDGILLEPGIPPIEGREAIRAFIASFPGVRVDAATATPESTEIFGDTAIIWGAFHEKLAFPGQPESEQHGKFIARWVRGPGGAWLLHRLYRIPITTQEFPPATP